MYENDMKTSKKDFSELKMWKRSNNMDRKGEDKYKDLQREIGSSQKEG